MHAPLTLVTRALAAVVIIALPVLLVLPFHPEATLYGDLLRSAPWWLRGDMWIIVEWGGNVAAFAVFAIALAAFIRNPLIVLLVGCATSACCELAQLVIPDRVASLGDFVLNSSGVLMGVLIAVAVRGVVRLVTRPVPRLRRT